MLTIAGGIILAVVILFIGGAMLADESGCGPALVLLALIGLGLYACS